MRRDGDLKCIKAILIIVSIESRLLYGARRYPMNVVTNVHRDIFANCLS